MTIVRFALSLILITSAAISQGTVIKTVFKAQVAAVPSAPLQNRGQALHNVVVAFPAATAAVSGFIVRLEASYDAATWFPIAPDITSVPLTNGQAVATQRSNGVYPFVRINLVSGNGTDGQFSITGQQITVYYSGSPIPIPQPSTEAERINVFDYGAIGDGVHDDTPNINAACVASAAQHSQELWFPSPPAFYRITGTLRMDGCRMRGIQPVLPYPIAAGGDGSRIIFDSAATPAPMVFMDTPSGTLGPNGIEGIYFDGSNRATDCAIVAMEHGFIRHTTFANCTFSGLTLDGAQNSEISNNTIRGSTSTPLRVVNGAASLNIHDMELTGGTVAGLFTGTQQTYNNGSNIMPGWTRNGGSATITTPAAILTVSNSALTLGPQLLITDGGTYPTALDLDWIINSVVQQNVITCSAAAATYVVNLRANTNITFSDNNFNIASQDAKLFYLEAGSNNRVNGGTIITQVGSTAPIITTNGGYIKFTYVAGTDAPRFTINNTSSTATAALVRVQDDFQATSLPFSSIPAPTGTIGRPIYSTSGKQLGIWQTDHYVDVSGNPVGICKEFQGASDPTGTVIGNPCDRYSRTTGGSASTLYVKEAGVSNTSGWVAYGSGGGAGGAGAELTAHKGNPNGYAGLDNTGKVPLTQLPASTGTASAPAPVWVLSGFASTNNNTSGDYTRGLIGLSLDNGGTFTPFSGQAGFVGAVNQYMRDATITRTSNGTWAAAGTCDSGYPNWGPCMGTATSIEGLYSATYNFVEPGGINSGINDSWAPEFYTDNEGCPATGWSGQNDIWNIPCSGPETYQMFWSSSNSGDGGYIWGIRFTDANLSSYTDLTGTAGQATAVWTTGHAYDPSFTKFYNPSTSTATYIMFHVDQGQGCCGYPIPNAVNIQYATSTTLAGTFTHASVGDWTGQFNQHDGTVVGNKFEGPSFVRVPGTTTSARLYYDHLDAVAYPVGLSYIQADNIDFTNPASLSTATWGAPVWVGSPYPAGTSGGHWRHGTIKPFTSGVVAASLYALATGARNPLATTVRTGGILGPTWSTGSAAPAGTCGNGSMYSQSGTGALYVCQSGAWVAK